ncbi:unnamed protein product [Cuscuta epithymum]|uniref:DUF674 family protein n=1 Tax=Cuscuta epithymum TaxID=186058 RepID=A0AAV0GIL4_9ASTE|nr:unnamed protein product [Cuscuta epithymum]
METKQESPVCLKLLIDEKNNRVLAAEANSDFVDILLSFLTIPMGTIIRLTGKTDAEKAGPVNIGCMTKLYHAFENLTPENWKTKHCRTMVLNPRNTLAYSYRNLKINVDDSGSEVTYTCNRNMCRSKYENVACKCGHGSRINTKFRPTIALSLADREPEGAFLKWGMMMFIITDNLQIRPSSPVVLAQVLSGLGFSEINLIKEMPVHVSKQQVIRLLASSMVSNSPLSDVFLDPPIRPNVGAFSAFSKTQKPVTSSSNGSVQKPEGNAQKLNLNLTLNKSTKKILFAEATKDFFDFLCTFMTTPVGSMVFLLKGNSGLGCMDDLYKSMIELDIEWFNSVALKATLICPKVAKHHNCKKQPLNLEEECPWDSLIDPRQSDSFSKEPLKFIILDDLEVKPLSSASSFSILKELKVPITEIEQQALTVSMEEFFKSTNGSNARMVEYTRRNRRKKVNQTHPEEQIKTTKTPKTDESRPVYAKGGRPLVPKLIFASKAGKSDPEQERTKAARLS